MQIRRENTEQQKNGNPVSWIMIVLSPYNQIIFIISASVYLRKLDPSKIFVIMASSKPSPNFHINKSCLLFLAIDH